MIMYSLELVTIETREKGRKYCLSVKFRGGSTGGGGGEVFFGGTPELHKEG